MNEGSFRHTLIKILKITGVQFDLEVELNIEANRSLYYPVKTSVKNLNLQMGCFTKIELKGNTFFAICITDIKRKMKQRPTLSQSYKHLLNSRMG